MPTADTLSASPPPPSQIIKPFVDPNTHNKLVFLHEKDAAARLPAHFDPAHIDDSLGGQLPLAGLWDYARYEQRMLALEAALPDAAAGAAIEAAAEAEAEEEKDAAEAPAAAAAAEPGSGAAAEEAEAEAGTPSEAADAVGTPSEAADAAAASSGESDYEDAEEGEEDAGDDEAGGPLEDAGAAAAKALP